MFLWNEKLDKQAGSYRKVHVVQDDQGCGLKPLSQLRQLRYWTIVLHAVLIQVRLLEKWSDDSALEAIRHCVF